MDLGSVAMLAFGSIARHAAKRRCSILGAAELRGEEQRPRER